MDEWPQQWAFGQVDERIDESNRGNRRGFFEPVWNCGRPVESENLACRTNLKDFRINFGRAVVYLFEAQGISTSSCL